MGKHLIRSGIILLIASMIAVGWVLFSQTAIAESLVPERGQHAMRAAIGEGQHANESETRTGAFPPLVRGRGEEREAGNFSSGERPFFAQDEWRPGASGPTSPIWPPFGKDEAGLNVGRLFASIVAHLVMIGLVVLVVVAIRKGFGLLSSRLKSAPVGGVGSSQ